MRSGWFIPYMSIAWERRHAGVSVRGVLGALRNILVPLQASTVLPQKRANVTSVPFGSLAHTFTIPSLGINIPVVGGSTEIAYIQFDHPGAYTWICLTPCGFGKTGLEGAMVTSGWMTGTITVS